MDRTERLPAGLAPRQAVRYGLARMLDNKVWVQVPVRQENLRTLNHAEAGELLAEDMAQYGEYEWDGDDAA